MSFCRNPQTMLALTVALLLAFPGAMPVSAQSMNVVDLTITVGKSLVIDYPVDIGRISTSSPEVVDAVPATAKEFLLHGKGHGAATVVVWAKSGIRTMYNVTVEHNIDPIRKLLAETFPKEDIRIQSGRDSITLAGRVSSKEIADRAVAIATPLAKTVVTNLQVAAAPAEQQIVLKVKFAELNRAASMQFGVNLLSTGAAGGTIGGTSTNQFQGPQLNTIRSSNPGVATPPTVFNLTDTLNVFAFRPDLNLGAIIRALQAQDILQILAEPSITTLNGKEASFLAGGEFPVPVLQGGGNAGAVTIQFREYGIRLNFNPVITANSTIKMYVKPEVSTIDLSNAVSLSGFTIPALATRRVETNVELKEGQSFMIAGLIDDRMTEQMSKIPGLGNIPILGQLFKSRLERKSKTELVVIVTPELVKPYNPDEKLPVPEFPRQWLEPFKVTKPVTPPVPQSAAPKVPATDPVKKAENEGRNPFLFWKPAGKKAVQSATAAASPDANPAPIANPVPIANPAPTANPEPQTVATTPASLPASTVAEKSTATAATPAAPVAAPVAAPATPPSTAPASPAPAGPRPAEPAVAPVARGASQAGQDELSAIPNHVLNAGGGVN